jgi:hypothetical protein
MSFEKSLMRSLCHEDVRQLNELPAAPISQWAANHSEPPDEEDEIYDRAIVYLQIEMDARKRFNALSECRLLVRPSSLPLWQRP